MLLIVVCCICSVAVRGESYELYYERMLLAQKAIAEDDLDRAIGYFATAFENRERVFVRDAFNACQLAAYRGSEFFPEMWHACARSGIAKDVLLQNRHINEAYSKDSTTLNKKYREGRKMFLAKMDPALRAEFKERYETEQKIKGKPNYREVCSDNFNRILSLAKQGRFPSEDLIGTDDDMSCYYVLATLLHYPYSYTALQPYLLQAVKDGKFPPAAVIYIYSFNQTRTSLLYAGVPEDKIHFKVCYNMVFGQTSEDIAEVNRQRALVWLPSLDVERKATAVMRKHRLVYKTAF
jgi:hypothetical protein